MTSKITTLKADAPRAASASAQDAATLTPWDACAGQVASVMGDIAQSAGRSRVQTDPDRSIDVDSLE
jgi:hypothetical protein